MKPLIHLLNKYGKRMATVQLDEEVTVEITGIGKVIGFQGQNTLLFSSGNKNFTISLVKDVSPCPIFSDPNPNASDSKPSESSGEARPT